MESILFQVVFEGRLKDGADPEKAAEKLAQVFRLSKDKIQLLLSGRPVVIKKGLTPELAQKYNEILEKIGFESRIEHELKLEMPINEVDWAEPAEGAVSNACPKCGQRFDADSVPLDECPKCGIIISKYLLSLKKVESLKAELPGADPATPPTVSFEKKTITFEPGGFLRMICALEPTLPETISLPADEHHWEPAPLKPRFFAAMATFLMWCYGFFLLSNFLSFFLIFALMTGIIPQVTNRDVETLKSICAILITPYLFIYLPLKWNGLSYGQRMMGIWIAPRDTEFRDLPITPGAILQRFAGNILSLWVLNFIWPRIAGGKNLADAVSSTEQIRGHVNQTERHPALSALKPFAWTMVAIFAFNFAAKPFLFAYHKSLSQSSAPRASTSGAISPRQHVQQVEKRQEELTGKVSRQPAFSPPPAETLSPIPSRNSGRAMSPSEVLRRVSEMQRKYHAAYNRYSDDPGELLYLYEGDKSPARDSISDMIRDGDLKIEITASGFEIGVKSGNVWKIISERGKMSTRTR